MGSGVEVTLGELEREYGQFASFSYVYVIQAPTVKRWKFGITRRHPAERWSDLETASPVQLLLHGAIPIFKHRKMEMAIHTVLKPWHAKGEWFEESEAVLAIANAIRAQDKIKLAYLVVKLAEKQLAV